MTAKTYTSTHKTFCCFNQSHYVRSFQNYFMGKKVWCAFWSECLYSTFKRTINVKSYKHEGELYFIKTGKSFATNLK